MCNFARERRRIMSIAVNISKTQMAQEDEEFLAEKLAGMTFSPRIEQLFEKRKEIAQTIDLDDERTRRILEV